MKISEDTKPRLIVVAIVTMLAVTMVVAGWQHEEEQEIDVEEHPSELTLENHLQPPESPTGGGLRVISNLSSTSTIYVDNQGYLEFEVTPISISNEEATERELQWIRIELQVQGDFDEDLNIDTLKTIAVEDEKREPRFTSVNFLMPFSEFDGVDEWSEDEHNRAGSLTSPEEPVYLGHDIDSNEFTVEHRLEIARPLEEVGENLTMEFQAVVDGNISEEVVSTVHFNVEGIDES